MMIKCNICENKNKEFKLPVGDGIGEAIMEQHFKDEHPDIKLKLIHPKGFDEKD
jgi:hypothetical protein